MRREKHSRVKAENSCSSGGKIQNTHKHGAKRFSVLHYYSVIQYVGTVRTEETIIALCGYSSAPSLSVSKVQTVVYCTRSVYPEENEQLVKRVLEKIHTHPKLLPFR